MITYKPLLKTLIDKNIKKVELQKLIECSPATIAKISKNELVSLEIINKFCKTLNCKVEDVIEYVGE